MIEKRYDQLCDRLNAAASDDVVDPELFLDAELAIRGLLITIDNKEAVISNQRAEMQRMRMFEAL